MTNIEQIEIQIKNILGLKDINREIQIKEIAFNLYSFLKENNYNIVEKDFLLTFFTDIENNRTQKSIFNEIITFLISNNKIAITEKQKDRIRFMRKKLFSFQDSYQEILNKGFCDCNNNKSIVKCNSKRKIKAYQVL